MRPAAGAVEGELEDVHESGELPRAASVEDAVRSYRGPQSEVTGVAEDSRKAVVEERLAAGEIREGYPEPSDIAQVTAHHIGGGFPLAGDIAVPPYGAEGAPGIAPIGEIAVTDERFHCALISPVHERAS